MGNENSSSDIVCENFLEIRNIPKEEVCDSCSGVGTKQYANTSTWRHGMGGAIITSDVCDKCWGSGNQACPWPSWKNYPKKVLENKFHGNISYPSPLAPGIKKELEEIDACPNCKGYRKVSYKTTDTWKGNSGDPLETMDVCDKCWGSGSESKPWPSWKEIEEEILMLKKR